MFMTFRDFIKKMDRLIAMHGDDIDGGELGLVERALRDVLDVELKPGAVVAKSPSKIKKKSRSITS